MAANTIQQAKWTLPIEPEHIEVFGRTNVAG